MVNIKDTSGASKEMQQGREPSVKDLWTMLKETSDYDKEILTCVEQGHCSSNHSQ
jgi:hypothetical protein